MSEIYCRELTDSVRNAVEALFKINNLNESQIELGLRLFADGYEGNFNKLLDTITKLDR